MVMVMGDASVVRCDIRTPELSNATLYIKQGTSTPVHQYEAITPSLR